MSFMLHIGKASAVSDGICKAIKSRDSIHKNITNIDSIWKTNTNRDGLSETGRYRDWIKKMSAGSGRRFKPLIVAGLLAAASFTMAGCHGSQNKTPFVVPEAFDENQNYEITFWAKNDTNKTQTRIYEKAIKDFEALYPNVDVTLRLYTDYVKLYNDVITNISTNTTPNVCITYPDHIATYMTGENTVVPLDDLMGNAKYGLGGSEVKFDSPKQEEITPKFLEECKLGDFYYALPYMRSTEACFVNKTYVEQLGFTLPETLTWDFVWEVSEKAMEKDGNGLYKVNGQKTLIPFIYKSTDNMMIQHIMQAGTGYSSPEGEIEIFNEDTAEFLKEISAHAKTGAFSTFKISSYPANFLNAGQCLFAIDSTAGSTWMGSKAPLSDISADKFREFETAVMTIPQLDPANPKMISQGPSVCIFNKEDSGEVLASWLFTQYLLSNEVQIAYSQTEGYTPVTSKATSDPVYVKYLEDEGIDNKEHYDVKLKATKLLLDNIGNTFVTPVFNGSASLRDAAGQLIEDVTKSTRRKQNVDDKYLEKLYSDTRTLYHLDQTAGLNQESRELGPLPKEAKILLTTIVIVWLMMGGFVIWKNVKGKKLRA